MIKKKVAAKARKIEAQRMALGSQGFKDAKRKKQYAQARRRRREAEAMKRLYECTSADKLKLGVVLGVAILIAGFALLDNVYALPDENTIQSEESTNEYVTAGAFWHVLNASKDTDKASETIDAQYMRCAVYCKHGYTKSGKWTSEKTIAGKEEWIGKTCNLYYVNHDGTRGELIGTYEFQDTGYGVDGSMIRGESVAVWRPSAEECDDWISTYGDYVYIEFIK